MPITPLHLGLALPFCLNKKTKVSLAVFIFSQILMDIQPIITILFNLNMEVHGITHTFLGAILIAIFGTVIIKICNFQNMYLKISIKKVFLNMLFGTVSHIFLDSLMHADINLFYPFLEYKIFPLIDIEIINYTMLTVIFICLMILKVNNKKIRDIL